jgi:hypothetical protein
MTIIGYARVSTTDQDLSIQEAALRAAGCDTTRAEKRSGTTTQKGARRYRRCWISSGRATCSWSPVSTAWPAASATRRT